MDAIVRVTKEIRKLWRAVRKLQITGFQRPTWLTAPLTSTSWDGDSHSTTARTLIDLSAVFGTPANIKAVLVHISINDSGSAGGDHWFGLSPAAAGISIDWTCPPVNDAAGRYAGLVPCNGDGDIYYQIDASGANTMDVWLQIWAYWL